MTERDEKWRGEDKSSSPLNPIEPVTPRAFGIAAALTGTHSSSANKPNGLMRKITIGELADIVEIMNIKHSIDSGFAITHHGNIEGRPVIAISTWRGSGDCYILD